MSRGLRGLPTEETAMLPSLSNFRRLPANQPNLRGQLAAPKVLFGWGKRYAVAPVFSRFEDDPLIWFVWDADRVDSDGKPEVIRQEPSLAAALAGLDLSNPYEEENVNV
jgi:hypothetical protein